MSMNGIRIELNDDEDDDEEGEGGRMEEASVVMREVSDVMDE